MNKSPKRSSAKESAASKRLVEQFTAPRISIADRMEAGKRLRTAVPKASLGEYKPVANRRNPVEILEAQAKTRLQGLVPVRYAPDAGFAFCLPEGLRGYYGAGPSPSRLPAFRCNFAAICMYRTSASLPLRNATLSSVSMISMRRYQGRGSGT